MDTPIEYGEMYTVVLWFAESDLHAVSVDVLKAVVWPDCVVFVVEKSGGHFSRGDYIAAISSRLDIEASITSFIELCTSVTFSELSPKQCVFRELLFEVDGEDCVVIVEYGIVDERDDWFGPFDGWFLENSIGRYAPHTSQSSADSPFVSLSYPCVVQKGDLPVPKYVLCLSENHRTFFFAGMHGEHECTRGNEHMIVEAILISEGIADPGDCVFFSVDLAHRQLMRIDAHLTADGDMLFFDYTFVGSNRVVERRMRNELQKRTRHLAAPSSEENGDASSAMHTNDDP